MHKVIRTSLLACMIAAWLSAGGHTRAEQPPTTPPPPPIPLVPQPVPAPGPAKPAPLGPKAQFATPIYDFGRVQSGELVRYTFVFTNVGDQALEITHVQPSCGCTAAGEWSRKVEPGQEGTVPIQFNSANFNGQVFKTISVTSNDREKPSMVLQLKGTVWKPIELVPQYTVINLPPDVSKASASVRIVNHTDTALDILSLQCSTPLFSVAIVTNEPGKEYTLELHSISELPSGNNVQGRINLKTSSTKTPTLDIPFWVNVQPVVSVIPQRISLPPTPLKAKAPATITIQNNSTNALSLTDAAVNAPGVDVELKEVQPGRVFNAVVTFPEGFESPENKPLELTMKSSQPRMPEIRVPVLQAPHPMVPSMPLVNPNLNPPLPGASKPTAGVPVIR